MEYPLEQLPTIGVVIPAYNEAKNILPVLNAVCAAEWIREIILVNDGSTDETFEVAQCAAECDERLTVVHLPENQGKAGAMLAGVQALHTNLVIFLDADLVGLKPQHLNQLANPEKFRSNEMTIAVFRVGRILTNVSQRMVPHLSGQRCLWREAAEQALIPLAADRYGVETGLTIYARSHHWKIRKIVWRGVTHHLVWQKHRGIAGLQNRWQMYSQIMTVIARTRYVSKGRNPRSRPARKTRLTLW